jgi:hypothetical protein
MEIERDRWIVFFNNLIRGNNDNLDAECFKAVWFLSKYNYLYLIKDGKRYSCFGYINDKMQELIIN